MIIKIVGFQLVIFKLAEILQIWKEFWLQILSMGEK